MTERIRAAFPTTFGCWERRLFVCPELMPNERKSTKNYIAERNKLAYWLATPELERTPTTQKALAAELGVVEQTVSEWKTPALMEKVNELVDKHLADDYAMAVDSMKRAVRQGSFQHTKLYFEMIGKYVAKIAPTTPDGTKPYSTTSDAEIVSELAGLLAALGARTAGGVDEGSALTVDDNGAPKATDPAG